MAKPNPIIALWVHPRSMSTAIERIMRERGDLRCLHEPFMYYYYIGLKKKTLPHSELNIGNPTDFDGVVSMLLKAAETEPVFFKDMSYYVLPEIYDHPETVRRMDHLILIRDPRKSILSHHKLDPDITNDEVGIQAQWHLYRWLSTVCSRPPMIIQAEEVQQDAISAINSAWKYLDLPMKPDAFEWDSEAMPDDWHSVSGWHTDVISSSGIRHAKAEDEDEISRRFDEAAKRTPQLRHLLAQHLPYYQKLKATRN